MGMVLFGELMSGRAVYDRNSLRAVESEPAVDEPEIVAETQEVELEVTEELEPEPQSMAAGDADDQLDVGDLPEPGIVTSAKPAAASVAVVVPAGIDSLVADMALGRARITLLAAIADARDAAIVADALVDEALDQGLSVCRIDAGSGRPSAAPGLTDLCAEQASFGDVVHRVREGLAEVPWGERKVLDRRSMRPLTLVEALSDIYEVVIVSTGRIGLNSTLPLFVAGGARLVVVRRPATPEALVEAVCADAASLGFETVQSVVAPELESAVA
jgi:hypothetical protein